MRFAFDGIQIVGNDRIPYAEAGTATYDGKGHGHGVVSVESANKKISRFRRFSGTYTVNPDCTVTETDTSVTGASSHFDEFITPDGSMLTFVETDPGVVAAGVLSRGTGKRVGD